MKHFTIVILVCITTAFCQDDPKPTDGASPTPATVEYKLPAAELARVTAKVPKVSPRSCFISATRLFKVRPMEFRTRC